jgi:hypothetical protein
MNAFHKRDSLVNLFGPKIMLKTFEDVKKKNTYLLLFVAGFCTIAFSENNIFSPTARTFSLSTGGADNIALVQFIFF